MESEFQCGGGRCPDFKGKKLLVLGAAHQHCKIIRAAQEMGVYVIVTDYLENSPGKEIADKSYMFSIDDIDDIVRMCRDENVEGVLHGYIDPCQRPYYEICTQLGLPCLGTQEQYTTLTDKPTFKKYCLEHNVDIVPEWPEQLFLSTENPAGINYPVLVKPVDSRGSRGQAVCYNAEDVRNALGSARKESSNGHVIIEQYLGDCDEFQVTFFFINGKPYLLRTADRYHGDMKSNMEKVGICTISPSKNTRLFVNRSYDRVKNMLMSLGIQNGPVFMQGVVDGDKIRFFDPGLRFPGSDFENIFKLIYGLDIMKLLVNFAFNGYIPSVNFPEDGYLLKGNKAALLFPTVRAGKIAKIEGMDEILSLPNVIADFPKYGVGDHVPAAYNVNQRFTEIDIIAENNAELKRTIQFVYDHLKVYDEFGRDMLFSQLDLSLIN